jgi:hypothetical protein
VADEVTGRKTTLSNSGLLQNIYGGGGNKLTRQENQFRNGDSATRYDTAAWGFNGLTGRKEE